MKTEATLAVVASALANTVAAFPQLAENIPLAKRQDPNPWAAPGPGDVRAPCPGLNTL